LTVAGRRSRDSPGPDGAPRDDGLDTRWGEDYQEIVSIHPGLRPALLRVMRDVWDQGHRAQRGEHNPFWLDPDINLPSRRDVMSATPLSIDAGNRALRSFIVGLAIDVGVAITLVLVNVFGAAGGWDELDWKIIGFSVAKTVVASAGSYILRRFVDASGIPTPLPPAPVPPPADPEPMAGVA
jgi:hypothetical protein